MKVNKQELIVEAARLAKAHQNKKEAIEGILNDLDKEEKMSPKHISGISAVNDILKEMEQLEAEHSKILEQIKAN
jgi:hypothetical protein